MVLSLEERMRSYKSPRAIAQSSRSPEEATSKTAELIDLSKVIKRKSARPGILPPPSLASAETVARQLEESGDTNVSGAPPDLASADSATRYSPQPQGARSLHGASGRHAEEPSRLEKHVSASGRKLVEVGREAARGGKPASELRADIERLSAEMAVLKEQNRLKGDDLLSLQQAVSLKESELDRSLSGIRDLESEVSLLKKALYAQQDSEELQKQELEVLRAARKDQDETSRQYREELLRLQGILADNESQLAASGERNRVLGSELETLKARVSSLPAVEATLMRETELGRRREQALLDLEKKSAAAERETQDLRKQIVVLQANLDSTQRELASVQDVGSSSKALRDENARLKDEAAQLQNTIAGKESEALQSAQEIATLKSELEDLKSQISNFKPVEASFIKEQELGRRREQALLDLEKKSAAAERETQDLRKQIGVLQANLDSTQRELASVQDVESSSKALRDENARLKDEAAQLQDTIARKETESLSAHERARSLETELNTLKDSLRDKSRLIQEQIATIVSARTKAEEMEARQAAEASERERIRKDLEQAQGARDSLQPRVIEYERKTAGLRTDLENANERARLIDIQRLRLSKAFGLACGALIIIGFVLLYVYLSRDQLSRTVARMSVILQQNEETVRSKTQEVETLEAKTEANARFIEEQTAKIASLSRRLRSQRGIVVALNRTLTAKKEEVLRLREKLEETKRGFFLYRQSIAAPFRAVLLEQEGQLALLGKRLDLLQSVVDGQINAIERQTSVLKEHGQRTGKS